MKEIWYVAGESEESGERFPTFFDTKLAAERWARILFPDEDERTRYQRIYLRHVFTETDTTNL